MKKKVIVFGGGIGGLSVAQELTEGARAAHFNVEVVESRVVAAQAVYGGKASSEQVDGAPTAANKFPGEHGFRFFPTFYRHVVDTMSRIPSGYPTLGRASVRDHLVPTTKRMLARKGHAPLVMPAAPQLYDLQGIVDFLKAIVGSNTGIRFSEFLFFATRLVQIATSCERRRIDEYQVQSWWDFLDAGNTNFSDAYRHYLAEGLTRTLVAAKPGEINAKTGGDVLVRILIDSGVANYSASTDRVLDGPTSKVWIDPWVTELKKRGVCFSSGELWSLDLVGTQISSATIKTGGPNRIASADYFVCAVPVERMADVLDRSAAVAAAGERLQSVSSYLRNDVRFMTGLQFYLDSPLASVDHDMGHALYVDSNWALTGICQSHFWRPPFADLGGVGSGNVATVWSTIVADWDKGFPAASDPPAKFRTRQELRDLTIAQLEDGLNGDGVTRFDRATVLAYNLDASLTPGPETGGSATNTQPLLVNKPDRWKDRPDPWPAGLDNLMLASDYVRTTTDLATMEAANEAARRAVNAVLMQEGISPQCELYEMYYPEVLADHSPLVQYLIMRDEDRLQSGQAWKPPWEFP